MGQIGGRWRHPTMRMVTIWLLHGERIIIGHDSGWTGWCHDWIHGMVLLLCTHAGRLFHHTLLCRQLLLLILASQLRSLTRGAGTQTTTAQADPRVRFTRCRLRWRRFAVEFEQTFQAILLATLALGLTFLWSALLQMNRATINQLVTNTTSLASINSTNKKRTKG